MWIVENVPGAPGMDDAVVECGSAYDLGVRRHRLFLSNVPLEGSGCDHKAQGRPWGVYHVMGDSIPKGGRTALSLEHGLEVMGVDRSIPWDSLKEGFPPAYTEHLGKQLARCLSAAYVRGVGLSQRGLRQHPTPTTTGVHVHATGRRRSSGQV